MEPQVLLIFQLVLRIVGVIVCSNKAKKLNRNATNWGIFGFIAPILAIIWVQFMKPLEVLPENADINSPSNNKK
jgi:hypothetical protein